MVINVLLLVLATTLGCFFLCSRSRLDFKQSVTQQKKTGLMKTALNNVVLPTLLNFVNSIVQYC